MQVISNTADFKPSEDYCELLIGCGHSRLKELDPEGDNKWSNLYTLDSNEACNPDFLHDLEEFPYPFADDSFNEIHAYEVLEHTGAQGDWKFFFKQFDELWRILKPDGFLMASVPMWDSQWAWGDPGHKRVITEGSLIFLCRENYEVIDSEPEKSPIADYRPYFKSNWKVEGVQETQDRFYFVLKAIKDGDS